MRSEQIEKSVVISNLINDIELQQSLMQRIIGCTHELVNQAMQSDWYAVLDGMDTRRQLLQNVIETDIGRFSPEVIALSAAVAESERALTTVVAHALASVQCDGAVFALYA